MVNFFNTILLYPFTNLLIFFTWLTPGHYAAGGIILLTLLTRFILLVPSKRAAQSQRKLTEIQPLINELKNEYGTDQEGLAKAQMQLFKQNNINPFGSCLPLILQVVVLIFLNQAILHGFADSAASHLYSWVPRADSVNTNFFGIDLVKPDRWYILPIIAAAFQFFQIRLTTPKPAPRKEGEAADPTVATQQAMTYLSPLLTLFIAGPLPAGTSLYWSISGLFSVIQQRLVNKEKLTLTGITAALKEAEVKHPEHAKDAEKAIQRLAPTLESKEDKKGVSVTVRKKK